MSGPLTQILERNDHETRLKQALNAFLIMKEINMHIKDEGRTEAIKKEIYSILFP